MPPLTFDEFDIAPQAEPQTVGASVRIPRVYIIGAHAAQSLQKGQSSGPLTFDEFIPESGLEKAGRYAEDIGRSALSGIDAGISGLAGLCCPQAKA